MKDEIISRFDSYMLDLDSCETKEDLKGFLSDVISDALWYQIELTKSPIKLKLGDNYVEYLTGDDIAISKYPETSKEYTKNDMHEIIDKFVVNFEGGKSNG